MGHIGIEQPNQIDKNMWASEEQNITEVMLIDLFMTQQGVIVQRYVNSIVIMESVDSISRDGPEVIYYYVVHYKNGNISRTIQIQDF